MVVALAPPRNAAWLDWLSYWADVRGHPADNKSDLALHVEVDRSTVDAWFNRGTKPSYANVVAVAKKLRRPKEEALAAAGYETETVGSAIPDEPRWVVTLIDRILHVDPPLTPAETALVEQNLRGVLRFREEREAPYEANPPEAPEPPPGS